MALEEEIAETERAFQKMLRPARWCREYGADAAAAEHVGQSAMTAALIELGRLTGDFTSEGTITRACSVA